MLALIGSTSAAHEVRPALLQITQHDGSHYLVVWKQPLVGDLAVRMIPHLSSGALEGSPTSEQVTPGFRVRTWQVNGGAALDGQALRIEGLDQTVTDVLVQVASGDGQEVNSVIRPGAPPLRITLSAPQGVSVPAYLTLGVKHILTGFDHLLFVLGLLLLVGINWRIVKAVSAFTVAHSITLALAALGYVHFPSAVIEALVALSIVFVAYELVPGRDNSSSITRDRPWLIAFFFGLLHGLAFAGVLAQVGLPPESTPLALLLFNVGVEIGQLAFIAAAIGVILLLRIARRQVSSDTAQFARTAPAYVIGGLAAYWFIERVVAAYS